LRDLLAGRLRAYENRHARLSPDAKDDVVVAGELDPVRAPVELRHALEANHDLRRRPRECLPRANEDRDTRPPPVLDLEAQGDERLGVRVRTHALDLPVADVLTADRTRGIGRRHGSENIGATAWDGVRIPGRRLHRNERQDLQEMVLHDVTHRSHRVVESTAILHPEVLGHGDLDGLDVLAVPDRLEEGVREAEVHDVLHRLLAEEVVDPEQTLLGKDRGQALVQLAGGVEIRAEGLLHDEPCAVARETCRCELLGHVPKHRGRRREVEGRRRPVLERLAQALVERPLLRVSTDVAHAGQELVEDLLVEVLLLGGGDGLGRVPDELLPGELTAPDPDHRAREQSLLCEVVERG
jgi:hypothetical protein